MENKHDFKGALETVMYQIPHAEFIGLEEEMRHLAIAVKLADRLQELGIKYYGQNNHGTAYPIFWVIKKPDGDEESMFLFEEDAENHLQANSYRYPKGAHIYCKHVWRAPMTESFIKEAMTAKLLEEIKDE